MRDRGDELLGIARAGGNDRAAKRQRAAFEDPPAGRQMIGKAVDDDLAGGDARGGEGFCRAPGVAPGGFGFVDPAGRSKEARESLCRRGGEAAERRPGPLHRAPHPISAERE